MRRTAMHRASSGSGLVAGAQSGRARAITAALPLDQASRDTAAFAVGAAKAVVCADGPWRQGQAPAAGVLVQRAAGREGGVRRARQRRRSADRRHRAAPRHTRVHEHPRPCRHPPDRRDRDRERPAGDLQPARSRARRARRRQLPSGGTDPARGGPQAPCATPGHPPARVVRSRARSQELRGPDRAPRRPADRLRDHAQA
jgi:hypothetical protein